MDRVTVRDGLHNPELEGGSHAVAAVLSDRVITSPSLSPSPQSHLPFVFLLLTSTLSFLFQPRII